MILSENTQSPDCAPFLKNPATNHKTEKQHGRIPVGATILKHPNAIKKALKYQPRNPPTPSKAQGSLGIMHLLFVVRNGWILKHSLIGSLGNVIDALAFIADFDFLFELETRSPKVIEPAQLVFVEVIHELH